MDSITLCSKEGVERRDYKNLKTIVLTLKHINSFPSDIIVISGLHFSDYTPRKNQYTIHLWKTPNDSVFQSKKMPHRIHYNRSYSKLLNNSRLKLNGHYVNRIIQLKKTISKGVTFYCNPPAESYHSHDLYQDIELILDLSRFTPK